MRQLEFNQLSDIDGYKSWSEISEITKQPQLPVIENNDAITAGVTHYKLNSNEAPIVERSYKIVTDGIPFLLRTKPIAFYDELCAVAKFTDRLINITDISAARPLEVGACCEDTLAYSIYSWTGGRSADEYLRNLPTPKQFEFGIQAGKLLHRIHLMTPSESSGADKDFMAAYKARLTGLIDLAAEKCRSKELFSGCLNAIAYITAALPLLENRPQTALHGAYCLGSLFVGADGKIGLLPLKCARWGDPFSDFACINENFSYPYMRGQVKGYFGGDIPSEFFALLALYMAEFAINGVLAAAEGQEDEKRYASWQAERIASDFEQFQNRLPAWY